MSLTEYLVMFVLVAIMGAGIPGPGDASLIAAGTLAGEGRLNVGVVLGVAMAVWMLGSVAGYQFGLRGGRELLEHRAGDQGRGEQAARRPAGMTRPGRVATGG